MAEAQAELAKRTINLSTNSALNRLKWIRRNQDKQNLSNQNIKLNFSNNLISSISQLPISSFKQIVSKKNKDKSGQKYFYWSEGSVSIGRVGDTIISSTKDVEAKAKRNSGARCDQAGKNAVMDTLNKIFDDEDRYTKNNTDRKNNAIQLCGEQEFYLRYFDRTRKDGKRWFLSPEEASVNNIEKFSRS